MMAWLKIAVSSFLVSWAIQVLSGCGESADVVCPAPPATPEAQSSLTIQRSGSFDAAGRATNPPMGELRGTVSVAEDRVEIDYESEGVEYTATYAISGPRLGM
jgi:hypothetical protein